MKSLPGNWSISISRGLRPPSRVSTSTSRSPQIGPALKRAALMRPVPPVNHWVHSPESPWRSRTTSALRVSAPPAPAACSSSLFRPTKPPSPIASGKPAASWSARPIWTSLRWEAPPKPRHSEPLSTPGTQPTYRAEAPVEALRLSRPEVAWHPLVRTRVGPSDNRRPSVEWSA